MNKVNEVLCLLLQCCVSTISGGCRLMVVLDKPTVTSVPSEQVRGFRLTDLHLGCCRVGFVHTTTEHFSTSHKAVPLAMDVLKAVQTYVIKMITEVPGMKVLLLDAHTVRMESDHVSLTLRHRLSLWSRRRRSSCRTRCISQIG